MGKEEPQEDDEQRYCVSVRGVQGLGTGAPSSAKPHSFTSSG